MYVYHHDDKSENCYLFNAECYRSAFSCTTPYACSRHRYNLKHIHIVLYNVENKEKTVLTHNNNIPYRTEREEGIG